MSPTRTIISTINVNAKLAPIITKTALYASEIPGLNNRTTTQIIKSITNQEPEPQHFRHWRVREVTITSDPAQPVVGDGEKWGETPVTIKVLPEAIGVIAPA